MPPAKKPAARKTSRSANGRSVTAPITRKEVEAASARFDKLLDEANTALASMRKDLGKNARVAYKDVADALRKLRTDARGANKTLIRDLEKLAKAVAPGTSSARSTSRTASRAGAAKRATRSTAKAGAAKAGAAKSRAAKSTAAKSTAAKSTAAKAGSAARSAAKSTSARSSAKSGGATKRAGSSSRSTTSRSTTRRSASTRRSS
jgi:hypothetical protein